MSASLVGSEMCIRDRDSGHPPICIPLAGHAASSRGGSAPPLRTPRKAPVSYTHLTLPTICSV
eukprot:10894374-Alexandrium_andersonii.AAC.1